MDPSAILERLSPAQAVAARYGVAPGARAAESPPLLIIAGAGSGKTHTLAHRVAHLILNGADPGRVLLLTFTRRAAADMTRRAQSICSRVHGEKSAPVARRLPWSGTFHGIANRLLRLHADSIGLDPSFTVLDRSDAADRLDLLRNELGFARTSRRFPKKATCLAIYSHAVNSREPLEDVLRRAFPWCDDWTDELRELFRAYVEDKQAHHVLDYDDLLLYWYHLMAEPELARLVGDRFDYVLVDEYQDTNALQAAILLALKPDGAGVTVIGDDAQSIYSLRAATVRNILDFPHLFEPQARVLTLEQNYRSTQPILDACNAVIRGSTGGFRKELFSERHSAERPTLCTAEDETCQVNYVVERVLRHREAGIELRRQAVLIRSSHHSDALEVELAHRNIPFVKYGGLKFLEASHVKDVLCLLRWAENPRDPVAAFRVLQLLPGIGPKLAQRAMDRLEAAGFDISILASQRPPPAAAADWPALCALLLSLRDAATDWHGQVGMVRKWYEPHLERIYDAAGVRAADLEQLEQISSAYPTRERFLSELALNPPDASGDQAGPPLLDEDYLILSTIHSAKGQEWDVVYVLNVADGCIPSDMATGSADQIDEERRLLYVAMTRARDHLYLVHPLRFFLRHQHPHGDGHVYTPRTRFLPDEILDRFHRETSGRDHASDEGPGRSSVRVDVGARLRDMWD
jgi:DNA helicase-2/ATP-dependent DNA helicase PcrA